MTPSSATYQLLDSGQFQKLEQIGPYRLVRPAPQAIWQTSLPAKIWQAADATYHRSSSGGGQWEFHHHLPESWDIDYFDLTMRIKATDFGHLGIFPEQGENWRWLQARIVAAGRPLQVLNTFAYTGGSTLAAAMAGAEVVHLDSARGIVSWARENAVLSDLDERPVRWIVDDVKKFVAREIRRGNQYDGLILDPPSFGRGKKGEVWKFKDDLAELLHQCRQILSPQPDFILLSAHTPGFTPLALQNLLGDMMADYGGFLSSQEMIIPQSNSNRVLPSGTMARWEAS